MLKRVTVLCIGVLFLASLSFGGDLPELTGKIAVGKGIISAAFDGKTKRLYLLTSSNTLEVVDGKGKSLIDSVDIRTRVVPDMEGNGIVFNSANGRIYFPGERGRKIIVYSSKTGKVLRKIGGKRGEEGYANGVGINKKSNTIVKVDQAGYISIFDANDGLKEDFNPGIPGGQKYYTVSPDGEKVYVMHGNDLYVVNIKEKKVVNKLNNLDVRSVPFAEPVSGDVIIGGASAVYRIDAKLKISRVPLKAAANHRAALAINARTGHLFVPLEDGSVEVVKATKDGLQELTNIKVGAAAKAAVVDQETGIVYVTAGDEVAFIQDSVQ